LSGIAFECYGDKEALAIITEEAEEIRVYTMEVHGKTNFISKPANMLRRANPIPLHQEMLDEGGRFVRDL
jgi:hypothetical protein